MLFKSLQKIYKQYRLKRACHIHPAAKVYYERYCELEKSIAEFLANNETVISIQCVGFRQCYDTNWHVKLCLNGEIIETNIVRSDMETTTSLLHALKNVHTTEELRSLDMHSQIYYD